MNITRSFMAVMSAVMLAFAISGCSSDTASLPERPASSAAATPDHPPTRDAPSDDAEADAQEDQKAPDSSGDEGSNEGSTETIDYTDPSEAEDYCGVFTAMESFSEEAGSQNSEASLKQIEERIDILARTAERLEHFADSDEERNQWAAMKDDSQKAVDFLRSSGGQPENDDFIVLLGKAYDSSAKAYEAQRARVKDECGVDLADFMASEQD